MYDMNQEEILDVRDSQEEFESNQVEQRIMREKSPIILPFIFSLILTALSFANPFLIPFANNLQTQNLYATWAMEQGQTVYSQIFGTSGILYYLVNGVSGFVANEFSIPLTVFIGGAYFLALFFAGRSSFQLAYSMTGNKKLANELAAIFYIFVLLLGFGGFYASIFALPFTLSSVVMMTRYTALEEMGDDNFIVYGILAALGFMFDPLSASVLYLVAFVVLFFFNIANKRKARGFYQLLASLFGFSIIFYPIGYYTVLNGSFGEAITQVTYPFNSLSLSHPNFLSNFIFYGLLLLALGLVTAWIINLVRLTRKELISVRFLSSLGLLLAFVLLVMTQEQGGYQLIPYLPFILILLVVWLEGRVEGNQFGRHRRRVRNLSSAVSKYFTGTLFLPVLVLGYLVLYPVLDSMILSRAIVTERISAATYISENSQSTDQVYAWDTTASLYQESQRLSASPILSPAIYQGTEETKLILNNSLSENSPAFILVNNDLKVSKEVQELLNQNYQTADLSLKHFKLYQKTN